VFHEPGRSRWRPLLVALGLVAAASGLAAVVSLVQSGKRPASAPLRPSAGVVSVSTLQTPPGNRPLLWFRDDSTGLPFVLKATDWSGRLVGRLSLSCDICGVLASADGQRLLIGNQSSPQPGFGIDEVFSSSGALLSTVDGYQAQWADDGRHLCTIRARRAPEIEDLRITDTTTGSVRVAASFAIRPLAGPNGAAALLACSASQDRALLAFTSGWVRALTSVRLSTGTTRYTLREPPPSAACACDITSVAVSGDGALAVEDLASGAVRELDVASGTEAPVSQAWLGRGPVMGLSWDAGLAVTTVGVYTFPSGASLWQAPLPAYMLPVSSRPRTDDVLLSVWQSSSVSGRPIVVRPSGATLHFSSSDFLEPPPS
jgi:hypothetical protein